MFYVELRLNSTLTSFRQAAKQASFVEVNIRAWKSWSFLFRLQYRARILKTRRWWTLPCRCPQSACLEPSQSSKAVCKRDPIVSTSSPGNNDCESIIQSSLESIELLKIGILPCSIGWLLSVAVLMGCWLPFHSATKWKLHVMFTSRKSSSNVQMG